MERFMISGECRPLLDNIAVFRAATMAVVVLNIICELVYRPLLGTVEYVNILTADHRSGFGLLRFCDGQIAVDFDGKLPCAFKPPQIITGILARLRALVACYMLTTVMRC